MNIYSRFLIIAGPPLVVCHQINAELAPAAAVIGEGDTGRAPGTGLRLVACCIFVRWAFITARPEQPRLEERGLDTAH